MRLVKSCFGFFVVLGSFSIFSISCKANRFNNTFIKNGVTTTNRVINSAKQEQKEVSDKFKTKELENKKTNKESKKEKIKRLEKEGASSAIEQIELYNIMRLDPKTPLSHWTTKEDMKKQNAYEYIRDFFASTNVHRLCFQFVFDKYDYPYSPMNSAAVQLASQFLIEEILGKSKDLYIDKKFEHYPGCYSMPIGALHVDYPIYVKDKKAQDKLQTILNEKYYDKSNYRKIISNIIKKIENEPEYFAKKLANIIIKLKSNLKYCDKKIETLKKKDSTFYADFGRNFLASSISACILAGSKNIESIGLAKSLEQTLKDEKKVSDIGKSRVKDLLNNLNDVKKYCTESIKILEGKEFKYYQKVTSEGKVLDGTKYDLKDVVIECLKNMRKIPTRPVVYNDPEETYILKLNIKYEGM